MNMSLFSKQPLVIDTGSAVMKAGLSGEEKPGMISKNVVGRPKHHKVMISSLEKKETIVGNECDQHRGLLRLSNPMNHGVVENWEDMEQVWKNIYSDLKINP